MRTLSAFTLNELASALQVTTREAKAIRKMAKALPSFSWFSQRSWNRETERLLSKANTFMCSHGVEAFVVRFNKNENRLCSYVNTGDSYNTTLLAYHGRIYVGCWADLAERYPIAEGSDCFLEF